MLATADGAPLLGRWQLGLGQVAAWTSDLGARWGAGWARWAPFDKLWAQIARATMRKGAASHFAIRSARARRLRHRGGRRHRRRRQLPDAASTGTLDVTAVGRRRRGRARPRALPLPETAPGRYETSFRPDIETGALLVRGDPRSTAARRDRSPTRPAA